MLSISELFYSLFFPCVLYFIFYHNNIMKFHNKNEKNKCGYKKKDFLRISLLDLLRIEKNIDFINFI